MLRWRPRPPPAGPKRFQSLWTWGRHSEFTRAWSPAPPLQGDEDDRRAHELLVEFRGPDGAPVETVGLPDTRLLDLIKVRGKLTKNEFGSLVFDADGFWKISRPELPSGLNWPE